MKNAGFAYAALANKKEPGDALNSPVSPSPMRGGVPSDESLALLMYGIMSPSPMRGGVPSDTGGLKHADDVAFKGRFCEPPELGAKILRKVRRFAKDFQNLHVSPGNHYSPE